MSEEYGNASFIRPTEAPERAKRGSGPKKARYTGLSIASLRENIRMGRLEAKIAKYNREYEELWNLAKEVNSDRQELENGNVGYEEVSDSIKRYNAQAKRLAEIGVQVLAFDTDIKKINLSLDSQVKAIRVPGFLIGPLRMLTKAGRAKAAAEKQVAAIKAQNEKVMYDAIVATAQDAIGQRPEDTASKDGMMSLRPEELATTIKTELGVIEPAKVEEPVADPVVVEEKPVEPVVDPVVEPAKAEVTDDKKKAAVAGAMGAAYKKKADAKKKNTDVKKAVTAVKENDVFGIIKSVNDGYGLKMVEKQGKRAEMLYVRGPEKNVLLKPSELAQAAGITDQKEAIELYKSFITFAKVARLWNVEAAKEVVYYNKEGEVVDPTTIDPTQTVDLRPKYNGAFDEDRKVLFDFVVTSVEAGLSEEELLTKAEADLTPEEAEIVSKVVKGNYGVVQSAVAGIKAYMTEEPIKDQEAVVEPVVEDKDSVAKKKAVVNEKLIELGMAKYGKKPEEVVPEAVVVEPVADPVVEAPAVETPVQDEKEEEQAVEATPAVVEAKAAEGSYVDQINRLVDDIASLSKARDGLRAALGDEASEQLESIEKAISDKLAQINALALGGIVALGKDGDKKEEQVVVEAPVVTEDVKLEEPVAPEVVVDKEEDQPSLDAVVEKAVLDETGAHIVININLGNVYNQGGNFAINIGEGLNVQVIGGDAEVEVEAPVVTEGPKLEEPVVPEVVADADNVFVPVVEGPGTQAEAEDYNAQVIIPSVEEENAVVEATPVEVEVTEDQDLEHRDAIMWWNEMVPFLDKPKWERDLAAERADRKIEDVHFEERKAERIAEDKAARQARAEANKEKRARSMLSAYGMTDEALDAMEKGAEAGEMTPYEFLEKLKVEDEDTYNHIVTNYIEVKRNELSALSADLKAQGKLPDSETDMGPFKR